MNDAAHAPNDDAPFSIGEWTVDPALRSVSRGAKAVKLSPRAFGVLLHLSERAGQVVARDELLEKFWHGTESSPNAVHKVIVELRHAFSTEDDATTYFETVPRRGYRLAAAVAGRAGAMPTVETAAPARRRRWQGPAIAAVIALSFAAIAGVASLWSTRSSQTTEVAPRVATPVAAGHQIAVPPARARGDAPLSDTVARELTDALRSAIGGWPGVVVVEDASDAHAFAIDAVVQAASGRMRVDVAMLRTSDGVRLHAERYDLDAARAGEASRMAVTDLLAAFEILLDDARAETMRKSGTGNVRAFRMKEEGDALRASMGQRAMELGAERLRDAIRLDPDYRGAYCALGSVLGDLGVLVLDSERRRTLGAEVVRLDESMLPTLRARPNLASIWIANQQLNSVDWKDVERRLRIKMAELGASTTPSPLPVYPHYAALLASARLPTQAARVLTLSEGEEDPDASTLYRRADVATWSAPPQSAVVLQRNVLERHPAAVLTLADLVMTLAHLGEYGEAERYLARLEEADADGRWAAFAAAVLSAFRGERAEPADERLTDYARGIVHFVLTDVDAGVAAWSRVDTDALRNPVLRTVVYERLLSDAVRNDPRYQASLDALGVGSRWTAHMLDKYAELAPLFK